MTFENIDQDMFCTKCQSYAFVPIDGDPKSPHLKCNNCQATFKYESVNVERLSREQKAIQFTKDLLDLEINEIIHIDLANDKKVFQRIK